MRVRYAPRAARDLEKIVEFISTDNPRAAASVVNRIGTFIETLAEFPHIGGPASRTGVLTCPIPGLPYRIHYRLASGELQILHIRHGRRRPLKLS